MMKGTARLRARALGGGMTMRVYAVDRNGTITRDRGTITVTYGNQPLPPAMDTQYPPCRCLHCRTGQVVRR
ncbi:hypothetical protein ACFZCP_26185 [Streptomyces sp. NPDC007971]|uniref:hypothetical protein n=1 Tax=Streptomyces sp. NPDC007971 TaxID=3364799 RepID=UPI0036E517DF